MRLLSLAALLGSVALGVTLRAWGQPLVSASGSWNAAKATQFNNNTTLFNLTFVAKENGNVAEIVQINSDVTKAEAYDSDAKVMAVT